MFLLTGFADFDIILVSFGALIASTMRFRMFAASGGALFFRRGRPGSEADRGVQQRGQMVAQHRQRYPDGEHRAETSAGAGEFHGINLLSVQE